MTKPIFLVGEAPGENEAKIGRGFVGTSGAELLRMLDDARVICLTSEDQTYLRKFYSTRDPWMLDAIWQMHPELYRTNVFQEHPPGNDLSWFCGPREEAIATHPVMLTKKPEYKFWRGGYLRQQYAPELERLGDELLREDPNLVVAMGNSALWALAGRTGITKLRGTTCISTHIVSGYKLLLSYHPAAVVHQWELRPTAVVDFTKINREKDFPDVRRPACEIWTEPSLEDISDFIRDHIQGCEILSCDIETSGSQITCVGFAPRPDLALVVPIHDTRTKTRSYWPTAADERQCWELIRQVLEDRTIPKLFQNGLYDIAFLWRAYGLRVLGATHDTMLLHHALQPEALKGLGYLGSVYTDHGPWKVERKGTETIKRDE